MGIILRRQSYSFVRAILIHNPLINEPFLCHSQGNRNWSRTFCPRQTFPLPPFSFPTSRLDEFGKFTKQAKKLRYFSTLTLKFFSFNISQINKLWTKLPSSFSRFPQANSSPSHQNLITRSCMDRRLRRRSAAEEVVGGWKKLNYVENLSGATCAVSRARCARPH